MLKCLMQSEALTHGHEISPRLDLNSIINTGIGAKNIYYCIATNHGFTKNCFFFVTNVKSTAAMATKSDCCFEF